MARKGQNNVEALDESLAELDTPVSLAPVSLPSDYDPGDGEAEESYAGLNPPGLPEHEAEVARNIVEAHARGGEVEEDADPTIARLKGQIVDAHSAIARLEGESAGVALMGGNLDAHLKKLALARERIAPLTAALATARQNRKAELRDRDRANVEALVGATKTANATGLKETLRALNDALATIAGLGGDLRTHLGAITWANAEAERIGRRDLTINAAGIRGELVEELTGNAAFSTALPRLEQMHGETEDAYSLRQSNAEARVVDAAKRADPMLASADLAIGVIEEFVWALDPHQRARTRRMVSVQSYRTAEGQRLEKISDTLGADGKPIGGAPHKPRVGPYRGDGIDGHVPEDPGMGNLGFRS